MLDGSQLELQRELVQSLRRSAALGPATQAVTVVETHISYVLLTGRYAYKIKKAVNLGFLDFTSLDARRFYCEEEVRLNRRFTPVLYLGVVALRGSVDAPTIGGDGPVLDYAVKMRQFDQEALFTRLIEHDALTRGHIDDLARTVASFHVCADRVSATQPFGSPEAVLAPALENFSQALLLSAPGDRSDLESLRAWTTAEYAKRKALLSKRQRDGFVRECHGDLHLNNVALVDGQVALFDCIEFNEEMRWTDVMSDVAFLVMDLHDRGRADLASRFLNAYLEITGDYEGVVLLPFYVVYRAMVRAKVARLRIGQLASGSDCDDLSEDYRQHIRVAQTHGQGEAAIVIMHGLTGSGKTTTSEAILEATNGVRVRTDVERRRMSGLLDAPSGSPVAQGIYTDQITTRVYQRVCELVRGIASSGYVAIADGAFLRRWQRDLFRQAASAEHVPFLIVSCAAPLSTLRRRIAKRGLAGRDASEATVAVLERQAIDQDPLGPDEEPFVVRYDASP